MVRPRVPRGGRAVAALWPRCGREVAAIGRGVRRAVR